MRPSCPAVARTSRGDAPPPGGSWGYSVGQPRPPGLSPVAADAGTSSIIRRRESHVERLHRAGASGPSWRAFTRSLPRAGGDLIGHSCRTCISRPCALPRACARGAMRPRPSAFFDTITVHVGDRQSRIMVRRGGRAEFNLRDVGADRIGISVDETTTEEHLLAVPAPSTLQLAGVAEGTGHPRGAVAHDALPDAPRFFNMNRPRPR